MIRELNKRLKNKELIFVKSYPFNESVVKVGGGYRPMINYLTLDGIWKSESPDGFYDENFKKIYISKKK